MAFSNGTHERQKTTQPSCLRWEILWQNIDVFVLKQRQCRRCFDFIRADDVGRFESCFLDCGIVNCHFFFWLVIKRKKLSGLVAF